MTKVIIFGSFDLIHKGHIYFFKEAKRLGKELIVIIARDKTIEKVKNKPPLYNEKQRLKHVQDIGIPDKVLLGNKENPYKIIKDIKPDIIALGYDQDSFTSRLKQELKKLNLNPKVIRIKSYKPEIYKSSKLKRGH